MSAIFGLVHQGGRAAAERDLDLMGTALAAHGPDRYGIWVGEQFGLGQRLMSFTPQDLLERQPLIGTEGRHVLVTDGRIDNRPELMHELGIPSPEARAMPDSAFILRSYQKWGAECCSRLIGDFVFALCDLHKSHVLIARSAMSTHALFYHAAPGIFAFASAPKGLFALPWIPREIDQQRLADYLVGAPREPGRSFFAGISELATGYAIVVRREGFQFQRHWQPDLGRETRFPRDSDYVEAFNMLFDRVISDSLRSLTPVGAMMSGGLDSSSVAVTAARQLSRQGECLATFTEVPRAGFELAPGGGRYADETPFVCAIGRQYRNMDLNFVPTANCFFLDGIDLFFNALEGPFKAAWNRIWWEAILRQASNRNLRVLLTGIPGNFTISRTGDGLLAQLIREGKWRRAIREAQLRAGQNGGTSSALTVLAQGAMPFLPTPLWRAAGRLLRPDNPVFRTNPPWRVSSPIHPEFARFHRVTERARQKGHDFYARVRRDTPANRYAFLRSHDSGIQVGRGYEALFGVQSRNPTGDVRIVEFCLSLPEEQFQNNGISRSLIRRAMEHRLPPEVLSNQRRGVQAADWFEQVNGNRFRMLNELARIEDSELAARAIDLKRIRAMLQQTPELDTAARSISRGDREILGTAFMTGSFLRWVELSGRGGG
jgi:asparagine synthase (glutamine-hydrolysing)